MAAIPDTASRGAINVSSQQQLTALLAIAARLPPVPSVQPDPCGGKRVHLEPFVGEVESPGQLASAPCPVEAVGQTKPLCLKLINRFLHRGFFLVHF
jgi:hypothetical protein